MDQLANTNRDGMEYVLLLTIAIGSEDLAISRDFWDETLIHTNQSISYIDIHGNGDWDLSLGSQNSCNKTSIDFGRNMNDGISVNPSITIGSIIPQVTRTKQGRFNIFDSFRETLDISDRNASWHGEVKI